MDTKPATPKFVRWAVMLGIIIALSIFFSVLSSLLFPAPKYEDFCKPINPPMPVSAYGAKVTAPQADTASVDYYTQCQKPYNDAMQKHQLNTFVLLTVLGVLSIILGILPLGSSIVSAGLSYGGVLTLIVGAAQYWGLAGSALRLVISFVALAALLFIGLKRFRD